MNLSDVSYSVTNLCCFTTVSVKNTVFNYRQFYRFILRSRIEDIRSFIACEPLSDCPRCVCDTTCLHHVTVVVISPIKRTEIDHFPYVYVCVGLANIPQFPFFFPTHERYQISAQSDDFLSFPKLLRN